MKKILYLILSSLTLLNDTPLQAQWQNLGSGIDSLPRIISCLRAVNKDVVWATSINPSFSRGFEFTKTTNGGLSWQSGLLPDTLGNYIPIALSALDSQTAWVLMIPEPSQNKARLFKTTTGGLSWIEQTGGFNAIGKGVAAMHFFNANEGIVFGSCGTGNAVSDSFHIYRTNDGGSNWSRISGANMPTLLNGEGIWLYGNNCYESYGDTLWCVTRKARVFKTVDRGISWQAYATGLLGTNGGLASIAFQNPMQGIATAQNAKATRTDDGGLTWDPITIPANNPTGDIEFVPGTVATYIVSAGFESASSQSFFMITKNGGNSWDTVTYFPGLSALHFLSPTIAFGGGHIISATEGGIYKWTGDLSDSVTTAVIDVKQETAFKIYPNPASTQILIATKAFIKQGKISILNLLGETIQEAELTTPQIKISVADLPKGIYMVRLTAEGQVQTQKIVVQ